MKDMSKWYPLEGYPYADEQAHGIEKMLDRIKEIQNKDGMSEEAKHHAIRAVYDEATALAFDCEIRFDCIIEYIDWLYGADEEAAALDLAIKLFHSVKDMVNPNLHVLETICYRLEELLSEMEIDNEELTDEILFTRVRHDV